MLRSMKNLEGYNIHARDGEIGKASDFLFDDTTWALRYVVVDTGNFLTGRKVIVPPHAFGKPDWNNHSFPVDFTKQQVKDSPPVETTQDITRDYEENLFTYFRWQPYWGDRMSTGAPTGSTVTGPTGGGAGMNLGNTGGMAGRSMESRHLKSVEEVRGYDVGAIDGTIGQIEDFLVDDDRWHLRYAVIDTRKWLPGKKVMVPIPVIQAIREDDSIVRVEVPKENIKNAPEYDPDAVVNRKYEEILYDYYGRPRYWK